MTKGMTAFYLLLTLVGGIAIIVSMIKIQWVDGDDWRARGLKREAGLRTDPARRGVIYSSDGKILATTVTECDLYLDLLDTIVMEKGKPKKNSKGEPIESGIPDSCFNRYIDTVCLLLNEAAPLYSAAYYRELITAERSKAKPNRCFCVLRSKKGNPISIPYSTWLTIKRLPGWGIGVVKQVDGRSVIRQVRAHIYGNMAENTIGFVNSSAAGTYTGLEGAYDSILRGQDGIFNCRRLTKGIWLPDEPRERKEVPQRTDNDRVDTIVVQNKVDGQDIVATIDTRYQDIAESALRKALLQYNGTGGCAILMEVETGYVLACANLELDTASHRYLELRDRNIAVNDVNHPGSTFKSVVLTAMLNDSGIEIDTAMMFRVGEKNYLGGHKDGWVRDDHRVVGKDGKVRDSLNVREIIEQSSNVGMVEIGWKYYRMKKRSDVLRNMMREVFPYDMPNVDVVASPGKTRINDVSSVADFTRLCFGYATQVSPLQIITFYNALAANGRMVKPLFCRATIDDKGRRREVKPIVLNPQAFDPGKAKMLKDMLVGVVNNGGTGKHLKSENYLLAGKTGTAKKSGAYDASFAGFFPADNPKYTCFALIENCHAYGWQAGQVVKSIADCVVAMDKDLDESVSARLQADSTKAEQKPTLEKGNQRGIAQVYSLLGQPYNSADPNSEWVYYRAANDSLPGGYVPYAPAEGKVPNCYGMSAKDAIALLHSMGFKARVSGYGKVASQQPKGGSAAKSGATVVLNLK